MLHLRHGRRALILVSVLAVVAVATPAGAAVPTTPPTGTVACANGKTARVWTTYQAGRSPELTMLAADNPCPDRWLEIAWPGMSESDPYGDWLYVAPHSKFNWDASRLSEWGVGEYQVEANGIRLVAPGDACVSNFEAASGPSGFRGWLVSGWDSVKFAPECGQPVPKYNADRHARVPCPTADDPGITADLAWKLDGKKVIKVGVYNPCPDWVVARWQLASGRTVGVWVAPGGFSDLWLNELDPAPTLTKDGKVGFGRARDLGVDRNRIGAADPKQRPFWYNATASGDTLACRAGPKPSCR